MEALIAALNPRMINELKTLDAAEVSIRFDPESGQPEWSAILPEDDGTFAALASALVLSGGLAEAPLGELAVDRLAGPGSPLMARAGAGTLLASGREGLKMARARLEFPPRSRANLKAEDGLEFLVEPGSLASSKSLTIRRLAELIASAEGNPPAPGLIQAHLDLQGKSLRAILTGLLKKPTVDLSFDPSWYDSTPRDRAISSFALAIDPAAKTWEALFAAADRIEKLDPAQKDVAPIQIRLALLARLSGLRLETDLLGHLLGVSGWVGSSDRTRINNALLVFHLDDVNAAERIVAGIKPLPGSGKAPANAPDRSRWLGQVDGQPLRIVRSDRDVSLTWGEGVLEASTQARSDPERSAGHAIRERLKSSPKFLAGGLIWPERVPSLGLAGVGRGQGEGEIPPMAWFVGPTEGADLAVRLEWEGIDQAVRRFLENLPLDPPPDH